MDSILISSNHLIFSTPRCHAIDIEDGNACRLLEFSISYLISLEESQPSHVTVLKGTSQFLVLQGRNKFCHFLSSQKINWLDSTVLFPCMACYTTKKMLDCFGLQLEFLLLAQDLSTRLPYWITIPKYNEPLFFSHLCGDAEAVLAGVNLNLWSVPV